MFAWLATGKEEMESSVLLQKLIAEGILGSAVYSHLGQSAERLRNMDDSWLCGNHLGVSRQITLSIKPCYTRCAAKSTLAPCGCKAFAHFPKCSRSPKLQAAPHKITEMQIVLGFGLFSFFYITATNLQVSNLEAALSKGTETGPVQT